MEHKWYCARLFFYAVECGYIKFDTGKWFINAENEDGIERINIICCPFCGVELEKPAKKVLSFMGEEYEFSEPESEDK